MINVSFYGMAVHSYWVTLLFLMALRTFSPLISCYFLLKNQERINCSMREQFCNPNYQTCDSCLNNVLPTCKTHVY